MEGCVMSCSGLPPSSPLRLFLSFDNSPLFCLQIIPRERLLRVLLQEARVACGASYGAGASASGPARERGVWGQFLRVRRLRRCHESQRLLRVQLRPGVVGAGASGRRQWAAAEPAALAWCSDLRPLDVLLRRLRRELPEQNIEWP